MRSIEQIRVDAIDIDHERRPLQQADVDRLTSSIERIGLQMPVTVRYFPDRPGADGTDDSYVLVTGAHRLAAAKKLGWEKIECFVSDCDEIDAQLWEISENLHRAELSALERDEQIARWIDLTEAKRISVQPAPKLQRGRPESGTSAAARELGIEETDAKRAVKVAAIAPAAKDAARAAGLDDNRTALLAASKEAGADAQVAKISELALAKVNRPAKPVKLADEPLNDFETTERQVAALMSAWNKAGREARERFLATVDKPIMDRRHSA